MTMPCALCGQRARDVEWTLPIGGVVRCRKFSLVSLVDLVTGSPVSCDYDER